MHLGGQVILVENRNPDAAPRLTSDHRILGGQRLGGIKHREHQVRFLDRASAPRDADFLNLVRAVTNPGSILQDQRIRSDLNRIFDDIAGSPRHCRYNRTIGTQSRFMMLDFPTLGLPTIARCAPSRIIRPRA